MTVAERPPVRPEEERLEFELDPALQDALRAHLGQWVAITRRELIAFGDDPNQVLADAQAQGVENPMIFRVPDDEAVAHYF
jgi:hypothetical protein